MDIEVIIALVILVVGLILGMPIPFSFGASFLWLTYSMDFNPNTLLASGYTQINSVVLLAIPLFVLAGKIMEKGQIGDALIGLVERFVGWAKSGLGAAAVVVSAVFGSISGSASATLSCIGSLMYPRMLKAGYPKGYTAALLAAACPLGLLIPPSSAQILYAWSSGTSVLACFLATIVPGIIVAILFCVVQHFQVRKLQSIADATPEPMPMNFGAVARRTGYAIPALLMPVIVLGGIYGGYLTTMEAAAVAAVYCVPVAILFYRGMKFKDLWRTLVEGGYNCGAVAMMLMSCGILSRIFTTERIPDMLVSMASGLHSKFLVILMINVIMIILGMLMDDGSAIVLSTPLLLPIALSVGMDPVHYAAIMGVNLGMGLVTPPCAPMLFLGAQVAKSPASEAFKPTMQYILFAWLPTLILTTCIPEISLWLPHLILGTPM